VTYVDGDRVWAFGHPLDAAGRRELFLQDAYVYTVVNNPLATEEAETYKLAAPGHDVGVLTGDGLAAVAGRLGVLPAGFPLRIVAHDEDRGRVQTTQLQLADESAIGLPTGTSALSTLGPIALTESALTILGAAPKRQSGSMCVRFDIRERPRPLRFCNTYVGTGGDDQQITAVPLLADFGQAVDLIDAFDAEPLHVTRAQVDVKLRRGLRQAFLVGASAPSRVRRGHDVRVRLTMRRVRGPRLHRTIKVHVPRSQATGDYDLTLTGTDADQATTQAGGEAELLKDLLDTVGGLAGQLSSPTSVDELGTAIAAIHRYDGVTVSLREPGSDPDDADERPAYRDPELRVSGSATVPVTVVSGRKRR
jgi:hypothetical protein